MKKEIYIVLGLVLALSTAMFSVAQAVPLSFVTATAVDTSYGGRLSDYTISFQVGSSTQLQTQIKITFPAGFDVTRASSAVYGSTATSTVTAPSSTGTAYFASSTVSGQGVTAWLVTSAINNASNTVQITISDIKNPDAGNSAAIVDVQTRTQHGGAIDIGSSTSFAITGASPTTVKEAPDKTAPTTLVTTPSAAVTISAGQEYVIKGIADDAGGSYVQKVEVSVDDGKTWLVAERDGDIYGGSYRWKYVWSNPKGGNSAIKARATDAAGNVETPGTSVAVTVSAPAVTTPTPAPAAETSTIQSLQLQVVSLQQQVVALLQQLIQLLQGQM